MQYIIFILLGLFIVIHCSTGGCIFLRVGMSLRRCSRLGGMAGQETSFTAFTSTAESTAVPAIIPLRIVFFTHIGHCGEYV